MWTEAGITPARAGKTATMTPVICTSEDHPRSCGKDHDAIFEQAVELGSPPLVRERRRGKPRFFTPTGITPARAGKTLISYWKKKEIRDHPRSCGKDFVCVFRRTSNVGSPPLVRERRCLSFFRTRELRITPARAGKTVRLYHSTPLEKDHPRSCGKDPVIFIAFHFDSGSPPLVRERLS